MQARKEPIGEGSRSAIIEQVNLGNDAKQGPENYSAQGEGVDICTGLVPGALISWCFWLATRAGRSDSGLWTGGDVDARS